MSSSNIDPGESTSLEPKPQLPAEVYKNRQALAEQFMPYVRSIAGKIKKTVAKTIVEYGMIGLLEAADRYSPEHGANFMTFAYYRIRGAIYDGLRGMGWMSRTEYAKARQEARYEERANEYLAEMSDTKGENNPPSFESSIDGLSTAVRGLAAVYITTLDGTEGLQVPDDKTPLAEEALGLEEARRLVRETICKLSKQERRLLELYYYEDKSLQQVGDELGLSKSWTSRLHARVVEKLHRLLAGEMR
jgi:RNA polymerase sigma factor FliA